MSEFNMHGPGLLIMQCIRCVMKTAVLHAVWWEYRSAARSFAAACCLLVDIVLHLLPLLPEFRFATGSRIKFRSDFILDVMYVNRLTNVSARILNLRRRIRNYE